MQKNQHKTNLVMMAFKIGVGYGFGRYCARILTGVFDELATVQAKKAYKTLQEKL